MNLKCLPFFLLISFFSFGQNPNFEFQDKNSIPVFLEKNDFSVDNKDLYVFKNLESFLEYNKNGYLIGPIIFVFNSKGEFLETIDPETAEKKLTNFKRIKNKSKKNINKIDFWKNKLLSLETSLTFEKVSTYEYYFIINWGIFFNEKNKFEELFDWYNILKRQRQNYNIKIILLNMDLQNRWNLKDEVKMSILNQANNRD